MSFFKSVISGLASVAGASGSIVTTAATILGGIPGILRTLSLASGSTESKQLAFDQILDDLDRHSGTDHPLIRNLPPDAEEKLFDGLKETLRVLGYWAIGVYGSKPTESEVGDVMGMVAHAMSKSIGSQAVHAAMASTVAELEPDNVEVNAETSTEPRKSESGTIGSEAGSPAPAPTSAPSLGDPLSFLATLERHRANPKLVGDDQQIAAIRDAVIAILLPLRDRSGS